MLPGGEWVRACGKIWSKAIRAWGKFWLGSTSKNVEGQLRGAFPSYLNNINLKLFPYHRRITDLRKKFTKNSGKRQILKEFKNMTGCLLEVKSWKTRALIKAMSVYHFVDPGGWAKLKKRKDNKKRRHLLWNKGLRHFENSSIGVWRLFHAETVCFFIVF